MPGSPGEIARRVAARLDGHAAGPVTAEVERLLAPGGAERPRAHVDPSDVLALASLVVSVVQLAWTVYRDLRREGLHPDPEALGRRVRLAHRDGRETDHPELDGVLAITVEELLAAEDLDR